MSLEKAVAEVQRKAEADKEGDLTSHGELLAAIHRLQLQAESPDETVMRMRWEFMSPLAVRTMIEYGILQAIAEAAGKPVTALELSRRTSADELLILRIMRLVTYHGFCDEQGHGVYSANAKTAFLVKPAILGGFTHIYDFGFRTAAAVPQLVQQNKLHQFPQGIGQQSPLQHTFGDTMFGVLAKDVSLGLRP